MPIYMSERRVEIFTPYICCDSCGSNLDLLGDLTTLKLERSTKKARFATSPDGFFEVPGIPKDEAQAQKVAIDRGWKAEKFHKKEMLVCPNCQK
jgi:hypothetical protein